MGARARGQAGRPTRFGAVSGRRVGRARTHARSFFARDPVTREEAMRGADADRSTPFGELQLDLDQSDIALLGEQLLDEVAMCLDLTLVPVTATRLRNRPAMPKCKAAPVNSARNADIKMGRCRLANHAAINRRNYPIPKIPRKRPCHPCWHPTSSDKDGSGPRSQGVRRRVKMWGSALELRSTEKPSPRELMVTFPHRAGQSRPTVR